MVKYPWECNLQDFLELQQPWRFLERICFGEKVYFVSMVLGMGWSRFILLIYTKKHINKSIRVRLGRGVNSLFNPFVKQCAWHQLQVTKDNHHQWPVGPSTSHLWLQPVGPLNVYGMSLAKDKFSIDETPPTVCWLTNKASFGSSIDISKALSQSPWVLFMGPFVGPFRCRTQKFPK